jgi:hypothetical protein
MSCQATRRPTSPWTPPSDLPTDAASTDRAASAASPPTRFAGLRLPSRGATSRSVRSPDRRDRRRRGAPDGARPAARKNDLLRGVVARHGATPVVLDATSSPADRARPRSRRWMACSSAAARTSIRSATHSPAGVRPRDGAADRDEPSGRRGRRPNRAVAAGARAVSRPPGDQRLGRHARPARRRVTRDRAGVGPAKIHPYPDRAPGTRLAWILFLTTVGGGVRKVNLVPPPAAGVGSRTGPRRQRSGQPWGRRPAAGPEAADGRFPRLASNATPERIPNPRRRRSIGCSVSRRRRPGPADRTLTVLTRRSGTSEAFGAGLADDRDGGRGSPSRSVMESVSGAGGLRRCRRNRRRSQHAAQEQQLVDLLNH